MANHAHDLTRRLFEEVFNQRSFVGLGDIVAHDFVEHAVAPFGTDPPGRVIGPEHMRSVVEWLVAQYPDLEMTVESSVAEADTVVVRVSSHGTNLGSLNGVIPPTGRRFSAEQCHWYRVADGKLAEHWAVRDDLRTLIQLGLIPLPGAQTESTDAPGAAQPNPARPTYATTAADVSPSPNT